MSKTKVFYKSRKFLSSKNNAFISATVIRYAGEEKAALEVTISDGRDAFSVYAFDGSKTGANPARKIADELTKVADAYDAAIQ
jgi:hypothetical protein